MSTPTVTNSYLRAARRLFTASKLEFCAECEITSRAQFDELLDHTHPIEDLFFGPKDQHVNFLLIFAAIHQEI